MHSSIFTILGKGGFLAIAVMVMFLAIRMTWGTAVNCEFHADPAPPQINVTCSNAESVKALVTSNCVVMTQNIAGVNNSLANISHRLEAEFKWQNELADGVNSHLGELRNDAHSIQESNEQLAARFDEEIKRISNELQTMECLVLLLGLIMICLAAGGYFLILYFSNMLRTGKRPSGPVFHAQVVPISKKETAYPASSADKDPIMVNTEKYSVKRPDCPKPPSILSPADCLAGIFDVYEYRTNLKLKPSLISDRWHLGFVTLKGNIADANEDYVLAFSMGPTLCSFTLDGCGGEENGKYASYFGARATAISLIEGLGANPPASKFPAIARQAIIDGSRAIAEQARRYGLEGLRTTVVIMLASPHGYDCAYLGDGGGIIVRADDREEHFLIPQKAPGMAPNVLAASLGPDIIGEIQSWSGEVRQGDTVICCSDGMADRMPSGFPAYIAKNCRKDKEHLQDVVEKLATGFADFKDAEGFVADDNLSLTVIMAEDGGNGI